MMLTWATGVLNTACFRSKWLGEPKQCRKPSCAVNMSALCDHRRDAQATPSKASATISRWRPSSVMYSGMARLPSTTAPTTSGALGPSVGDSFTLVSLLLHVKKTVFIAFSC